MRPVLISCIPRLNTIQQKGLQNLINDIEGSGFKVHLWSDHKYDGLLTYDIEKIIFPVNEKNKLTRYWFYIKARLLLDKKKWFERIKVWFDNSDDAFAKTQLDKYIREAARVFAAINPAYFICWNPYCCRFGVAHDTAALLGFKTLAIDWGFLPDTFIVDKGVLTRSAIFNVNPFSKYSTQTIQQLNQHGQNIFAGLKEKSLSIYNQPKAEIPADFSGGGSSTKVLVIGIGEIDAGAYPAWHPERKGLLPFHTSAYQQAADIAQTNPLYRVIFKPHPSHNNFKQNSRPAANLAIVNGNPDELIGWADVVFCSGSKMEFSAILKDKPLLTYGAGLLYGKSCTYEVSSPTALAEQVDKALSKIDHDLHRENFITFLGYLDSEYLYNFVSNNNKVVETLLRK